MGHGSIYTIENIGHKPVYKNKPVYTIENKEHKPLYTLEKLKDMAKNFSPKILLKQYSYRNIALDFDTAYLLGAYTLIGNNENLGDKIFMLDVFPDIINFDSLKGTFFEVSKAELAKRQSIALLCSLHNKATYEHEKAPEQIAGIVAAILDYDIGFSKKGFIKPNIDFAIDNCGMGGDLYRTPNVSCLSAMIVAADGIKVAKHGAPGNTDSAGSSDFMKYLGIELNPPKDIIEQAIEIFNFGYTNALDTGYKCVHVRTQRYAYLAHMNDIIGPMTNPLYPKLMKKKLMGVNHLIDPEVVARAYIILNEKGVTNLEHGVFLRGYVDREKKEGIDEFSVFAGGNTVVTLKDNKIERQEINVKDLFDMPIQDYDMSFKDMSSEYKLELGKRILKNEDDGVGKKLVLANAALIESFVNGTKPKDSLEKVKFILESGKPYKNIIEYAKFLKEKLE